MPCCGCCCAKVGGECCGPEDDRNCCKPDEGICCGPDGETQVCCPPERDCCSVYTIGEGEEEVCCAESQYCCFGEANPTAGICCEDTEVCCPGDVASSCCSPNQYCCDGVCSDTPCCAGSCDDENPCDEGCYCCDGVCQDEPCEECASAADCGVDECCVGGQCVPLCPLTSCSFAAFPVLGGSVVTDASTPGYLEACETGPWQWVSLDSCEEGCDCEASADSLMITDPPIACGFGPTAPCCPSGDDPP